MKTTVLWALVVLNAVLLVSFISRNTGIGASNFAFAQPAAQQQQPPPRPGDYLMIPAEVTGAANGIVYILDTTNSQLSAMTYNVSRTRLETMPPIDLIPIFQQRVQPNPPGRGNR